MISQHYDGCQTAAEDLWSEKQYENNILIIKV